MWLCMCARARTRATARTRERTHARVRARARCAPTRVCVHACVRVDFRVLGVVFSLRLNSVPAVALANPANHLRHQLAASVIK